MWPSIFCVCSPNYLRIISMTGSEGLLIFRPCWQVPDHRARQPCGLQTNDRGSDLETIPTKKNLSLQIYKKKTSETQKLWPVAKKRLTTIKNYDIILFWTFRFELHATSLKLYNCAKKGATTREQRFLGYPRS